MKTINKFTSKLIYLILVGLFLNNNIYSQDLQCGNGRLDTAELNKIHEFNLKNPNAKTETVNNLIRVYFHIFNDDNGTNTALTSAQMQTEFASLLATYAPDNICFLNCGVQYINSTALNENFNADNDPSGVLLAGYQVPNCINIFYMQNINGNNTACSPPCGYGGIALGGIPGTFFLVASGNIGRGSTIGHEMGHNLGLLHTFEKAYGKEDINGSNSSSAGDQVTDTNADPFTYNGQSCYSTSFCNYTGNCQDPNGATNFSPPYTNLMSYWWTSRNAANNLCYPNQVTTNGQFGRVNATLILNSALQNCESPSNVSISLLAFSSGYYLNSGINSLSTSNIVSFTGSTQATLGADHVTLGVGFDAAPNSAGLTQILTKPCQ